MNYKLSEFLIIFFSMINSPTMFQTMMNDIFKDLIIEGIIIMYLNNILIFTWILEDHYKAVCKILGVLTKH